MNNKIPVIDFLIYSPPKTGSTALFRYLSRHDELSACAVKEPQFFSQLFHQKDIDWYNSLFNNDNKLKFESSSTYFSHHEALNNILATCKNDIKFIVILRNPVDRFISNYIHFKSQYLILNNIDLTNNFINDPKNSEFIKEWIIESKFFKGTEEDIDTILNIKNHYLIQWSMYHRPINKLMTNVDPKNIMYIKYEHFKTNNQKYLNQICSFIQVKPYPHIQNILDYNSSELWKKYSNITKDSITSEHIEYLKKLFYHDVYQLENLLNQKMEWI